MLGIDRKAASYTWTAALVLLLFVAVYLIREALVVFVIALLFAYLLYPLVDLFDRHLSARTRTPALAMAFILVIGVLSALGISVGSAVATQAANLATDAPAFLDRLRQTPAPGPPVFTSFKSRVAGLIEGQLRQNYDELARGVPKVAVQVLSASRNLIYLIVIPILSFLILRDGRKIRTGFLDMLDSGREAAREALGDVHELLLLYMRALLFLCCATFISYSIVLSAMGVPFALLMASIALPLEFIPLIGPLTAALVIITVSAVSGYAHVLWVVIFLGIYRVFQDYILSPILMSKGVELHPLLVIFGIIAGGELAGVAGIFLSIPVLALARLLYHRFRKAHAARRLGSLA